MTSQKITQTIIIFMYLVYPYFLLPNYRFNDKWIIIGGETRKFIIF